jgi:hypothetical protein
VIVNREILLIFAFLALVPASVNADELEDYIEHVREVRMEAMAEIQVRTIASILAGNSTLTYKRDEASGRYWPRFGSTTCPSPYAGAEERLSAYALMYPVFVELGLASGLPGFGAPPVQQLEG